MQITTKRVALITGANKGIGLEIARQIGRKGVIVLLDARNPSAGNEAESLLAGEGIEAHFIHIDVVDYVSIESAGEVIASRFGRLDIRHNRASRRGGTCVSYERSWCARGDANDAAATK